jgi:hypothetical protein
VILKSCIQQGLQGCPASFLLLLMASGSCVVAILLPLLLLCSYLTSALCSVSTLQKKTSESFEVNGWKGNSHLFPPEGPS